MIKKILNVTFMLFSMVVFSQEKVSKDENGKIITEAEFQRIWRDNNLDLYRWDYMENDKRICTLKKGKIQYPEEEYETTLKKLEKKLDTVFTKNAIIVLDFWYYKDICSLMRDDHWSSSELREVKNFNEPDFKIVRDVLKKHKQDFYIFYIFEKGSTVKKGKSDYFKSFVEDTDNFFRENYFKAQAMCGSKLIITPSGTLLYNGEAITGSLLQRFIN